MRSLAWRSSDGRKSGGAERCRGGGEAARRPPSLRHGKGSRSARSGGGLSRVAPCAARPSAARALARPRPHRGVSHASARRCLRALGSFQPLEQKLFLLRRLRRWFPSRNRHGPPLDHAPAVPTKMIRVGSHMIAYGGAAILQRIQRLQTDRRSSGHRFAHSGSALATAKPSGSRLSSSLASLAVE